MGGGLCRGPAAGGRQWSVQALGGWGQGPRHARAQYELCGQPTEADSEEDHRVLHRRRDCRLRQVQERPARHDHGAPCRHRSSAELSGAVQGPAAVGLLDQPERQKGAIRQSQSSPCVRASDRSRVIQQQRPARAWRGDVHTHPQRGMRNYRPDLGTPQKFDPAAARATLASSGASSDSLNGLRFTYVSTSASSKTTAEFVQAQLKTSLGVDVVLDGVDFKTFSNRMRSGNYSFGGPTPWAADYPDAQDFYDMFLTGSGNQFSARSNKTYDDAVTAADAATDQAKRDAGYESAGKALISEAPVIFLYQSSAWYVVKPYVS